MLRDGSVISSHVDKELAVTLDLFSKGGNAILDGITAENFDVLRGRPVVSKVKKLSLLAGASIAKIRAGLTT
jgi:phytoene/squalene synthetase